ncbi:hypothetical protein [Bordetella holmesii]|uniref:N-acetyltransferase YedL n=2 Tax=Bordetella holmesii TaxID=35814 RepID=A0ABP3BFS0_9BORD|nr:hypothetical protein [Bordetella holmesii]AHV92919.1 hypothetical protein D560_3420 [Bordetella holmesii ATCC 51541]AIT28033.1 hypothetical protein D558_3393 [Bordetella holmesii 44057]EWM40808.1 hypothetical protein D555_3453 [Bordetella holmesii 35009]EWM44708.1 hypothetical protein D557_2697 [Bordetella holmesii 70147]AMD46752.1 hypothetical protein H558_15410 [Bordetella holmesii H558]
MNTRADNPVAFGRPPADIDARGADRQADAVAAPDNPAVQVSINAKVLPPTSLVDVPNFPPKIPRDDNEALSDRLPAMDEQTESNWADGSEPQPRAKNARSSLF